MPDVTGKALLQLIDAMDAAVDAAGGGELRGIKALKKLDAMGIDVRVRGEPERITFSAAE